MNKMTQDACRSISSVLRRLLDPLGHFSIQNLFRFDLNGEIPTLRARVPLDIRLATEADLGLIVETYCKIPELFLADDYPVKPADADKTKPCVAYLNARAAYLDRLHRGELCFVAFSGQQLAHINWSLLDWGELVGSSRIRLRPGEAYTTDGYTAEPFRGMGVHPMVLAAMLNALKARGIETAFTLASAEAVDSRKGLDKLGWKLLLTFAFWQKHGSAHAYIFHLWRDKPASLPTIHKTAA